VHIVTKILVFAAAVLSLVLAALTISYSVNADRVTKGYRDAVAARTAAEMQSAADHLDRAEQEARLMRVRDEVARTQADMQKTIATLQSEKAQLTNAVKETANSRAAFENRNEQLQQTVKTQQDLITSYRGEVTKLRDDELQFRRREIELVDRINELESQLEVVTAQTRALQEQLVEARSTAQAQAGGGGAASRGPVVIPGSIVRGRVVKTMRDDATGQLLAQIDLGTNDRMQDGAELYVVRGDTFLGNLELIKTDLRWSVGRVTLQKGDIHEGDVVQSRIR
jgi:hypothetical protein